MKLISSFPIIPLLLLLACSKRIEKTVKVSNFNQQSPFVFLTKFHIAAGHSNLEIAYRKNEGISSQSFYDDVALGMLSESLYQQFASKTSCAEKQRLLFKRDKFNLSHSRYGVKYIKLFDLDSEDLWYFYVFSCHAKADELISNLEEITITLEILNNGSHFGHNQQLLPAYTIIMTAWIGLIVKFMPSLANFVQLRTPNPKKMLVFGGLIFMAVAYFYELMHLYIYSSDGSGLHYCHLFYLLLKNLGETAITTMLIVIAWGWSITETKNNKFYVSIGIGSGVINIFSFILCALSEQNEEISHHYDTVPGMVILGLRFVILVVFLVGLRQTLNMSSGKIVVFIKQFRAVGGVYLMSWPVTVLLAELILPNYMQRQVITFVEEFVHIVASTVLCHMIWEPESAYRKISLQQDDNPLKMKNYKHK